MPSKRLTVGLAFVALLLCGALQAQAHPVAAVPAAAGFTPQRLDPLPIFNPAPMLAQSMLPTNLTLDASDDATADDADQIAAADSSAASVTDLRKALIALAMQLRDIRYVRGGHTPATGFDCSGFVRYVFAHAVGLQLPTNSAGQFLEGLKVKRADMEPGDLVFFHTHGRRRISHVGIYISEGRFIHSPTSGKSVRISSLDNAYWSKRFVGAKRPDALAIAGRNG